MTYVLGATWAVAFPLFTIAVYNTVISDVFLAIWALLVGTGSVLGAIGSLIRRDVKVELPGLYLTQVGMLLYIVAQFGFTGSNFTLRIAFTILLLWHSSLLWPRIVGLEEYRRKMLSEHRRSKAGLP